MAVVFVFFEAVLRSYSMPPFMLLAGDLRGVAYYPLCHALWGFPSGVLETGWKGGFMAGLESAFIDSKTKVIDTKNLLIRGHLLRCSDVAIQISNISMVSIEHLTAPKMPAWVPTLVSVVTIGAIFLSDGRIGEETIVLVLVELFALALVWALIVATIEAKKYLNIRLSSGDTYSIFFQKHEFMREVLQLLANIIETGTTPQTNFHISVKDCEIRENGSVIHVIER